MNEMMTFPDTWEEFEKLYGFNDTEEIYTNNSRLIPSFRVKQWLDHLPSAQSRKGEWIRTYRDGFGNLIGYCNKCGRRYSVDNFCPNCGADMRGSLNV